MKLEGGTHFLILSKLPIDQKKYTAKAYSRFDETLRDFSNTQRISPIFPIGHAPAPSISPKNSHHFVFFGPIYPGKLDFDSSPNLYLTLGTYNIFAWCENKSQLKEVQKFITNNKISGEIWSISEENICKVKSIHPKAPIEEQKTINALNLPDELRTTGREYSLLMGKAKGKAEIYWPNQYKCYSDFDGRFKSMLESEKDNLGKLTNLVLTNSAISNNISQAFTGTAPIFETESAYATHSLLGIGVASQALASIRDFASKVFTDSQLLQRVKHLKSLNCEAKAIYLIHASDQFFNMDHINLKKINDELIANPRDQILPTLTFFSGKGGFRATRFSLSAPLEIISGANTFQWTLLTLTHEISHILIEGTLGMFFSNPKDELLLERTSKILSGQEDPCNLYEQAEQLLTFGMALLYKERHPNTKQENHTLSSTDCSTKSLKKYILHSSPEANEILTHIFDFLYFYSANTDHYVRSLWSSWAVVPNIETRIPEYVNRTICAIFSSKMEWPIESSFEDFEKSLKQLQASNKDKNIEIIEQALEHVTKNREKCLDALNYRMPLIKFVRAFLYSSIISKDFTKEGRPHTPSKKDNIYSFSGLEFRKEPISNPLRFLEQHSVDHKPQMLRSVWMLQHLAFCDLL